MKDRDLVCAITERRRPNATVAKVMKRHRLLGALEWQIIG